MLARFRIVPHGSMGTGKCRGLNVDFGGRSRPIRPPFVPSQGNIFHPQEWIVKKMNNKLFKTWRNASLGTACNKFNGWRAYARVRLILHLNKLKKFVLKKLAGRWEKGEWNWESVCANNPFCCHLSGDDQQRVIMEKIILGDCDSGMQVAKGVT